MAGLLALFAQSDLVAGPALDRANLDTTMSPNQDFYQFANGNWLKNNPAPAEYSRWGSFEILAEKNYEVLHKILADAAANTNAAEGSNLQKIGDFFYTGMDSAGIEAEGIKPLTEDLKKIDDIKTLSDFQNLVAYFHKYEVVDLFEFWAGQDARNSDMVIAQLSQGGLGLPDRDYYVNDDQRSKDIREAYIKHMTKMFEFLGDSPEQAVKEANTVMNIETRLAKSSKTRVEMRDPVARYNKMEISGLQKLSPEFNWSGYFATIGLPDLKEVNVGQPDFFREISVMQKSVPLSDWKSYLRWHVIHSAAGDLNSAIVNENFDFYGKFLSGRQKLQPRWKRVLRATNATLGEALGQLYVEKVFPPEAKKRAYQIVMNLKDAFRERIKNLDWMSEATKKQALIKLNAFGVKIGYPDKWIDYSALKIDRNSYFANVKRAALFDFNRQIRKINKPVDPTEWHMLPQTVNAYYNPLSNEIVFPAAILQPPFFDHDADDAVNYGAMGAIIGHEMTHGFDDSGRKYDAKGNLRDWWTKGDGENFNKRAAIIVKQYNRYAPVDTFHVNGEMTQGENIADLGGLTISYSALEKSLVGKPRTKIDGFTPEQRFFLSWAQAWRNNIRREELLLRLKTDVHSPGKVRVNGPLANMKAFRDAFGGKPGDAMVLPDSLQVTIW